MERLVRERVDSSMRWRVKATEEGVRIQTVLVAASAEGAVSAGAPGLLLEPLVTAMFPAVLRVPNHGRILLQTGSVHAAEVFHRTEWRSRVELVCHVYEYNTGTIGPIRFFSAYQNLVPSTCRALRQAPSTSLRQMASLRSALASWAKCNRDSGPGCTTLCKQHEYDTEQQ